MILTKEEIQKNKHDRIDADEKGLIKLRIVSPFMLDFEKIKEGNNTTMRRLVKVKAILIHIHGGGFITLSSSQH